MELKPVEPIDINIHVYLHKIDCKSKSCTIFGKCQLNFRVIDEAILSEQGSNET